MTAEKGRSLLWGEYLLVLALLLGHALLQAHLAWADSDTIDEPGHLVAALSYTRNGTFRLYNVNPPLPRLVVRPALWPGCPGRYAWLMAEGERRGHIQSVIASAALFLAALFFFALAILAHLLQINRRLLEETCYRAREARFRPADTRFR